MILGIAIVFIIPLVLIFYSSSSLRLETLNQMEAKAFSQHVVDAAGEVWYAGKGARKTILVNYPDNMYNLKLSGDDINCILHGGELTCNPEIKYCGREMIISLKDLTGQDSQIIAISPAPIKNNYGITGNFVYSQRLDSIKSVDGKINSGLVVLVVKNEGPYVNIVRYTPEVDY